MTTGRPSDPKQPDEQAAIQVEKIEFDGDLVTGAELLERLHIELKPVKPVGKGAQAGRHFFPKRSQRSQPSRERERTQGSAAPRHAATHRGQGKSQGPQQQPVQETAFEAAQPELDQLQAADPTDPVIDGLAGTDDDNQAGKTLLRGSIWLSIGNIVSRLLGAAFILPWLIMLGTNANRANALFSQGYTIYGILLAIATFGFPSAISKVIGQLMAKKDGNQVQALTKQSMYVGLGLGVVFGFLLYVGAPLLSNGNPNVVPVLRSLAPAVLVFPLMSMIRGVFQGHQLMHVSALSDIVEQIARIVYLLTATVVILHANPDNWLGVVVQATFAAFIGAAFSLLVLLWGWLKYYPIIMPRGGQSGGKQALALVTHILKESWPFVVIGSSTNIFLFVDQYTYFNIMKAFYNYTSDQLQVQFALFSANPNKLVMIVISFAISIATTALPLLSGSKATLTTQEVRGQLDQVLRLTMLILLPSALGMFAIAGPLYKMFYPIDSTSTAGIYLLQFSTILTVILSLFMLLALVLQALSETRTVMRAFAYGLLIKLVAQIPFVWALQGMGALIATSLGMGFAVLYMLSDLRRNYDIDLRQMAPDLVKILGASLVMALVAAGVVWLMRTLFLPVDTKLSVSVESIASVLVAGVVLFVLYLRLGLLNSLLGSKINRLPRFLGGQRS
ncbi:polysaccharide biosynthesis protein [Leuconostocaceae bacterium ESL0723]|nr:polysaccharide biosynthesis protein [Leuconostocaceae bacterium ESL0723]